jgi:mannosyl-3-phosphoglycerate phosphatase
MAALARPIVVTDLDGTLLDEATYAWADARPALAYLREHGIALVLASSKTRVEMERIAGELGLSAALVVENGGALIVPAGWTGPSGDAPPGGAPGWTLALGTPRASLVAGLAAIAAAAGTRLVGFAALPATEIQRLTGLPAEAAAAAMAREYDEPFLLDDPGRLAAVEREAGARGFTVSRGGRFFHLTGPTDKGRALRALLDRLAGAPPTTIVLGDAANDGPMLAIADRPVVVPRPTGVDAALAAGFGHAECAPRPGPAGWNAAVLAVLQGERLRSVSETVAAP